MRLHQQSRVNLKDLSSNLTKIGWATNPDLHEYLYTVGAYNPFVPTQRIGRITIKFYLTIAASFQDYMRF